MPTYRVDCGIGHGLDPGDEIRGPISRARLRVKQTSEDFVAFECLEGEAPIEDEGWIYEKEAREATTFADGPARGNFGVVYSVFLDLPLPT